MSSSKVSGKELRNLGYPEGRVIGTAMLVLEKYYKGKSKKHKLQLLERVVREPALYRNHTELGPIAAELLLKEKAGQQNFVELNKNKKHYTIYGEEGIDAGAIQQMDMAMKLPIAVAGALMPDAHQGYGLPIGGVLAAKNAVIPYGVGVDIGCRMCMTVYDLPESFLQKNQGKLKKDLTANTRFGMAAFKKPIDHEVLERREFQEIRLLTTLKDRAWQQIGSSGGGNHFVDIGIADIPEALPYLNLRKGRYLAVLSHSGSRALGANIARHYTNLAKELCKLPGEARNLAWLDLDTEEGQEYWLAMNLAGDYASACHHQIHDRISGALGEQPVTMIENHHNFAWKEKDAFGNELIVHRKGATPASLGATGIIPGSMTSPGYIVKGKGEALSVNSAAHGAGRVMSRTQARKILSKTEVSSFIHKAGVEVIGSGLDESPMVYKDIRKVMEYQRDLVDVMGTFFPKIVRMCGDERFHEVD